MIYRKISIALLGLVAGAAVSSASAADLAHGVYFGSGNVNGNFTVDTANNIEIGQRAVNRFTTTIAPVGDVYTVPVGSTMVPGKTGSEWGFTFSVDTNADGNGNVWNLGNTISTLTMTDSVNGTTGTYNLFFAGNDNTIGNAGAGFQNSEALSFANIAAFLGDSGYNQWIADTYTFTLNVSTIGTDEVASRVLASNTIVVNAVPEPLTLSLFAAGLVGAGALRRRKKVQA